MDKENQLVEEIPTEINNWKYSKFNDGIKWYRKWSPLY